MTKEYSPEITVKEGENIDDLLEQLKDKTLDKVPVLRKLGLVTDDWNGSFESCPICGKTFNAANKKGGWVQHIVRQHVRKQKVFSLISLFRLVVLIIGVMSSVIILI